MTYVCLFDAVTPYRIDAAERSIYQQLLTVQRQQFTEVAGGMEADEVILLKANSSGGYVISNDRFRNYIDRYEWLKSSPERLIKGSIVGGNLLVPALSIDVPVFLPTGDPVVPLSEIDIDELTIVAPRVPAHSSNLQSNTHISMLEATMSNPCYGSDLRILDGVWNIEQVIGSETIFILTGCHVIAELLDRPIAEMLRDEIDRLGRPSSSRRSIVIGDWWWQDTAIQAHPLIAVGGPPTNGMTREILTKAEKEEDNGLCTAFIDEQFPKIAIWGELASQTRESVENFIHTNLRDFLSRCWK